MRVSRATFLETCGLALLGASLDAQSLVGKTGFRANESEAGRYGGRSVMQDATAPLFLRHLNTSFALRATNGTRARLVLMEVSERPVLKNVEQFSLIFHAPAGAAVPDGTHAFEHSALGHFDLFITSVGASNPRRTAYQACFSRHLSPGDARVDDVVQGALPCGRT